MSGTGSNVQEGQEPDPGDASADPRKRTPRPGLLRRAVAKRELGILVVAVLLLCYFQFANSAFLSHGNLVTMSQAVAPMLIMALGLVFVLILGEIDLSVGSTFGLAPAVMWVAYDQFRLILPVAVIVGLLACLVIGLVNGLVRVYFNVPSFVVTLGTFFLVGGLNVIFLNGFPKTPPSGQVRSILGGYPYAEIIWGIALLVVLHTVLKNTRWGSHTVATGGNLVGAKEAGIRVDKVRVVSFAACAVLAGLAGILEAMRVGSVSPDAGGAQTMFLAISAAVIGGTPLAGGLGTMIGAFLGAVVLAELQQGFTLLGVNANTFDVILGIAILVLMIFNLYVGRVRGRGIRGKLRRARNEDS